jgi:hypothetical protein
VIKGLDSPRRPGFARRSIRVRFVVDKVALGQVFLRVLRISTGPKAGMALVGHADANRHALLNTRKVPTSSWWSRGNAQWVVQQMRLGWRAGFQRLKTGSFG